MPNGTEGMLDKVLSKLTPRIIAMVLIVVILAFVVVISIAVNKGADINLWGFEIKMKEKNDSHGPPKVVGGMTAREFVATLPVELRGTVDESRNKIATTLNESKDKSTIIDELEARIRDIENRLADTDRQLAREHEEKNHLLRTMEEKEEKYLDEIMRLKDEITRWKVP